MKSVSFICLFILISSSVKLCAQDTTNMGKEFWVGYGQNGTTNNAMTIYLATGTQPASVTITIDSSGLTPANVSTWWWRTYSIPANTIIDIEGSIASSFSASAGSAGPIPKSGSYNAYLASAAPAGSESVGLYRGRAIHIVSTEPIVAYAHSYGSASSGATMLLPVEAWGGLYTSANSNQSYSVYEHSWMYVIAKYDNTVIEITPGVKTVGQNVTGLQLGVAKNITLMRGQIYQVMGAHLNSDADGNGGTGSTAAYELTGTRVRSITSPSGYIHPIAVFSGSSRTHNTMACGGGGGDNDIQQHFARQALGKIYLTTPFSNSTTPSSFSTCKYKIIVFDPTTVVTKNGVVLSGLTPSGYYEYESNTPDRIVADQPILVAQFMSGGTGCLGTGGVGDPEMVYLSPLSQGVNSARFFRNTKEQIDVNYLTIVVPTFAVATTTVDGSNVFDHSLIHPQDAIYTILVKRWTASKAQAVVQSTGAFVGTTYGLGPVESYAYNVGTKANAVNARDASVLPPGFTGVLPVTLTDFNAAKSGNDILLEWNTSHEINFDKFELERSLNGREFSRLTTLLSRSSGVYDAVDIEALKLYAAHPVIYYRLKMIDKDGKFNYSGIISIKNEKVKSLQVAVAPNPFTEKLQLQIHSEIAGLAKLTLRDLTGKLIESRSTFISAGSSSIKLNSLNRLQKGVYVVEIELNNVKQYVKAVKN
jgi:hypothetical protein